MMIKTTNSFGNFQYDIVAEVSDAQRDELASLGLLQVLQRVPASKAEKEMAGYEKRPDAFKRNSIAFSEANAAVLKKHLEAAKLDVTVGDKTDSQGLAIEANVSLYVPTTGEPAFKEEKAMVVDRRAKGQLAKLAANVGYTGNDIEDAEPSKAFLIAIRTKLKEITEAAKKQASL